MLEYDVVVVGGGPAGCMAAKYAAKAGASTLIIEAGAEIGKPVQCAGLISKRAIEESETKDKSFINCEIKGAIVRSQSQELMLESLDKSAFAIRRDIFDNVLASEAQREGAEVILKCRVKSVAKGAGETKLRISTANGKEEISARVVIGADGVNSKVAKMAGLRVAKSFLNCVQVEGVYKTEDDFADFAEIFVGNSIAPGFFAWAIPLGAENIARIGLCIDKRFSAQSNPLRYLKGILAEHPIIAKRYKGARSKITASAIPIGVRKRGQTVQADKGILLVGDAAAQVKPVTGGGVYYGMKCGKMAGEIAAKASLTGDLKMLTAYERRWRKEIGNEIAFGVKVHRLRCILSDKDFDTILQTLSQEALLQQIQEMGDMDYPSIVFHEFSKNPRLIKLMAKNIIKYLYTK
ncbi:Dehydrogenase (flavoprotein)/NADPH-dependent 2,4-dienoyl-CoA reductase, sulfur reductase [Methanophagales archaeon]|nr:Dehydrogenase (flavoprotein)/NADPH-dependent 2,4-dienoyl-CoA reductase, sulfur reductase [Methanophagales archaeon]